MPGETAWVHKETLGSDGRLDWGAHRNQGGTLIGEAADPQSVGIKPEVLRNPD